MTDTTIGLLLKLLLDKGAQQEVNKGLQETAKSVDRVSASVDELKKREKELKAAFNEQNKVVAEARAELQKHSEALKKAEESYARGQAGSPSKRKFFSNEKDIQRAQVEVDKYTQILAEATQEASRLETELEPLSEEIKRQSQETRNLAKAAGLTVSEFKKLSEAEKQQVRDTLQAQKQLAAYGKELQETERKVTDLRQASESLNRISANLFYTGSSVVGAIYLSANQEAQRIKEAGGVVDDTTQRWLTAQERIARSYQRIGRTAETAFIPLLEKAAALAEKGSKFVEDNPELVSAALNIGGVVATIGAVGMLVARGVRFVADVTLIAAQVKYAASTFMFKSSVDKFFAAVSGQRLTAGGTPTAAGAGATISTIASTAMTIVAGVVASAVAVALVNQLLDATGVNDKIDAARAEIREKNGRIYPGMINDPRQRQIQVELNEAIAEGNTEKIAELNEEMKKAQSETKRLTDLFGGLEDGLDDLSAATERAKDEMAGMEIIANLERENLQAEREYARQRQEVAREAVSSILAAAQELKNAEAKVRETLGSTLSSLSVEFNKANLEADRQFQQESARIASDGAEQILKINEDAQEQLRELEERFKEEEGDATRKRDALGLAKARRNYIKEQQEIERSREKSIAETRKETARQLSELRARHQAERQERFEKYKQDQADAKARAAQELAELQEAHKQRTAEIQRQSAEQLGQLARNYAEERRQRVMSAYEQIKDLGNAQNAERLMRVRYYGIILQDANSFMGQYAAALNASKLNSGKKTNTGFPSRQTGGYVDGGLYQLHSGEFVMSPSTTQAAQSIIGGQLSQDAILSALSRGTSNSFTVNDHRRFDASIPLRERRAIAKEAAQEMVEIFSGLIGAQS